MGQPAVSARRVQVGLFTGQIVGTAVGVLAVRGVEAVAGGFAADRCGDQAGLAGQDLPGLVGHPGFGGSVTFVVKRPGCGPQVLQDVDEVDHDLDVARGCFFGDAVDLVVVAID